MKTDRFVPGAPCTVKASRYMDPSYKAFLAPVRCVVVKLTRGGLVQVALADNPKKVFNFRQGEVHVERQIGPEWGIEITAASEPLYPHIDIEKELTNILTAEFLKEKGLI